MERERFTELLKLIIAESSWMIYKNRTTKTGLARQRRAINQIAESMGIDKLSIANVEYLQWG